MVVCNVVLLLFAGRFSKDDAKRRLMSHVYSILDALEISAASEADKCRELDIVDERMGALSSICLANIRLAGQPAWMPHCLAVTCMLLRALFCRCAGSFAQTERSHG